MEGLNNAWSKACILISGLMQLVIMGLASGVLKNPEEIWYEYGGDAWSQHE